MKFTNGSHLDPSSSFPGFLVSIGLLLTETFNLILANELGVIGIEGQVMMSAL